MSKKLAARSLHTAPTAHLAAWRGSSSLPVRMLVSFTILLGTLILAGWSGTAHEAGHLSDAAVVWLCMGVSVFQLAWYTIAKKAELNNRAVWEGRDAAFASLIMCGTSVLLLAAAMVTGGPQIVTHELAWNNGFWVPLLGTGILNIGIQFANVRSLAFEDASLVGPMSSTTPAIVIVFGMFVLGEYPGWRGWAGIWLLAIGTYSLQISDLVDKLMSRDATEISGALGRVVHGQRGWRYWLSVWLAPLAALKASRGVRWAFLAVLLGCMSLNYDALVARHANVSFASAGVFGIAGLGNLGLALRHKQFRGLNLVYAAQSVVLLVVLFAMLHVVLNVAFRATLMSHIGALKRLAVPLTIIGAFFFLGEKKKFSSRLVGGTIMTIGAILIALDM